MLLLVCFVFSILFAAEIVVVAFFASSFAVVVAPSAFVVVDASSVDYHFVYVVVAFDVVVVVAPVDAILRPLSSFIVSFVVAFFAIVVDIP